MTAYYNEFDPKAAAWLRELIKQGHIADGVVDERSITDVKPQDLAGFTQCHFFAGIGGWSYALRLAGIPDDFPCWTGSPPCQPFSTAGKQLGQLDERHLAPTFMRLVDECKPAIIFGEQVSAAIRKCDKQGMHSVSPEKAIDGISEIFGQVSGWSPSVMQRMPEGIRKRMEIEALLRTQGETKKEQAISERLLNTIPNREPSKIFNFGMSSQVYEKRDTVRSRSIRESASRKDDEGNLRDEQNTSRPFIGEANRLYPFPGQDRSWRGIHDRQCKDRLLGGECSVRRLGRRDGVEALLSLIDEAGATNSERKIASIINRAVEVSNGNGWLDDLFTELEKQGYACGSAVLPACSVGAPHKRDRLFFGAVNQLANNMRTEWNGERLQGLGESNGTQESRKAAEFTGCSDIDELADTNGKRPQGERAKSNPQGREGSDIRQVGLCDGTGDIPTNTSDGFWSNPDWLGCRDGKFRPVEPGTFTLANGIPARVGRLRGYGNAIVPQVAAEFIGAFMDSTPCAECNLCGFPSEDDKWCESCEEIYQAKDPNYYDLGGDNGQGQKA